MARYKFEKVDGGENGEGYRQKTNSQKGQRQGKKVNSMQEGVELSIMSGR